MARAFISGHPIDEPISASIRPGVMVREADYNGSGKHNEGALPPEHPERAAKGDLGLSVIPGLEVKPLSHPGLPFELKPKT